MYNKISNSAKPQEIIRRWIIIARTPNIIAISQSINPLPRAFNSVEIKIVTISERQNGGSTKSAEGSWQNGELTGKENWCYLG